MNIQTLAPHSGFRSIQDSSQPKRDVLTSGKTPVYHRLALLFLGMFFALGAAVSARAQAQPPGCAGSALGINLFTSSPKVRVGDTLTYSVNVFNGLPDKTRVACDATDIRAFIVTPDGKTNAVPLVRTTLLNGQSDFYTNAVTYVVRASDVRSDGTVRATANDTGVIHQNNTPSTGGSFQGVTAKIVP